MSEADKADGGSGGTGKGATEQSVVDTDAALEMLTENSTQTGIYLVVAVFVVVGLGSGITAFLYDALSPATGGFTSTTGAGLWLAVVLFTSPLVAAAAGFYASRWIGGGQRAYLAVLVGSVVGYIAFYLLTYVFGGLISDTGFGEIQFVQQFGVLVGVTITGLLAAFVGGRFEGW